MMHHHKCEMTPAILTILFSAVFLQCFTIAAGRPTVEDGAGNTNAISQSSSSSSSSSNRNCMNSSEVRNVCEMCAKVTKSRLAYPMCCAPNDQAGTRTWCLKFLNFGLTHQVWSFS